MIVNEYFFLAFIQVDLRHIYSPLLGGFLLYRFSIFIKKSAREVRFIFLKESNRYGSRILLLKVYQIVLKVV